MRKIILILFCLICFICCEISTSTMPQDPLRVAVALALKCMKMTWSDLALRVDYVEKDTFRLAIIDDLMKNSFEIFEKEYDFGRGHRDSINLNRLITDAHLLLDPKRGRYSILSPSEAISNYKSLDFLDSKTKQMFSFSFVHAPGELIKEKKDLSENLKTALENLCAWMETEDNLVKSALEIEKVQDEKFQKDYLSRFFAKVNPIKEKILPIILEDVNDEFKSAEELDYSQKSEEELAKKLIPLASAIDLERVNFSVH